MKEQYTKKDFPYLYFQTVQCYGRCGVRGKPLQSKERQYGDLVLPSRIEGDGAVVEILREAFMNAKGLTSIVIPEGVEEIGDKAFFGCTALRAVRLPSTLKRIGDHAFCGCTGMTEPLRLPAGVESIGDGAFAGTPLMATDLEGDRYAFVGGALVETKGGRLLWANAVTDLPQNGSIKIIGPYAYAYCKALRQIALPEGVWKIQEHAFDGCVCLERIDLPEITCAEFQNCGFVILIQLQKIAGDADMVVRISFGSQYMICSVNMIEDCPETFLCTCFSTGTGERGSNQTGEFCPVMFRQQTIGFHCGFYCNSGNPLRQFFHGILFNTKQYCTVRNGIGKEIVCIKFFPFQGKKKGLRDICTGIGKYCIDCFCRIKRTVYCSSGNVCNFLECKKM